MKAQSKINKPFVFFCNFQHPHCVLWMGYACDNSLHALRCFLYYSFIHVFQVAVAVYEPFLGKKALGERSFIFREPFLGKKALGERSFIFREPFLGKKALGERSFIFSEPFLVKKALGERNFIFRES